MLKHYLLILLMCIMSSAEGVRAEGFDDIRRALEASSERQVQEKIFLHTDNTCYFVGDTIWYKAYAVRADNLNYTDMSRVLYVELLTPDGMLVERQRIIVSNRGFGNGCFCLRDSLYSGYYELRAYTRWMLNFNVSLQRYSRDDTYAFYNTAMARDYFRRWDGLYSRVLPIYSRPDSAGDYTYKRMQSRPKQNAVKAARRELHAAFYPEGGHFVEGVPCRVAFELTDQDGAAVSLSGHVTDGRTAEADVRTVHQGRGVFTVTPGSSRMQARFRWQDTDYTFPLPKAEASGVSMMLDGRLVILQHRGLAPAEYGLSVLCRGVLKHFQTVTFDASGRAEVTLPAELPTGVNDVTLFDASGRILADRLFFVNNHDYDGHSAVVDGGTKTSYAPYEQISLPIKCGGVTSPMLMSVAVRDAATDEPTYDDGNIMTDLLLGSELRGFVANPSYYFSASDESRTRALDLLMMVQGWRRYNWRELSDTLYMERRYKPETSLTVEGGVYKMLSMNEVNPDEIASWSKGQGLAGYSNEDENGGSADPFASDSGEGETTETIGAADTGTGSSSSAIVYGSIGAANADMGVNHGGLKREVMVEAEVVFSDGVVGATQLTHDGGRYLFDVPPFYGTAVLRMKAYNEKDSLKKNMASRKDKNILKEDAYPDYFVKRDLFFPVFADKYSYYQTHAPEGGPLVETLAEDTLSDMETTDHLLQNLDVKGKRRGKRGINYSRPVFVADAYDLYNSLTDYGLSYGMYDMRQFPVQVARYLYGNMGRYNSFNVDGRIYQHIYYRTYNPDGNLGTMSRVIDNRNAMAFYDRLKLKSLDQIRVFTDYEPRNADIPMEYSRTTADVTVEMVPFADDGVQQTFRDRHIVISGFNEPAAFYSPDYSDRTPDAPTDYRRTLYWNPNAVTDSDGLFTPTFYNNGKETRIKVSVAGITSDGKFVY